MELYYYYLSKTDVAGMTTLSSIASSLQNIRLCTIHAIPGAWGKFASDARDALELVSFGSSRQTHPIVRNGLSLNAAALSEKSRTLRTNSK